jgi:hypothetical protein
MECEKHNGIKYRTQRKNEDVVSFKETMVVSLTTQRVT